LGDEKILSTEKEYSLTELNIPADWNNLPGMAKKHLPNIMAPTKVNVDTPFVVNVKVGGIDGIEHPNTLSHWINWIALYAGERLIARVEYGAELTDGFIVKINVSLGQSTVLRAQAFCNLHGLWEGKTKKISVE